MKIKTSDLSGAALDWAVANSEELISINTEHLFKPWYLLENYIPSTDWTQGGPIIEREKVELEHDGFEWWARIRSDEDFKGSTPLLAAMRCYVASKLGDEIEIPEELTMFKT